MVYFKDNYTFLESSNFFQGGGGVQISYSL